MLPINPRNTSTEVPVSSILNEAQLRELFDGTRDLIQSVLPNGCFLFVNRTWREVLGYSPDEVATLQLSDVIHPNSYEHCQNIMQRVMAGDDIGLIEALFQTKAGQTILVEGQISLHIEAGQPVATRGIFRNINEHKTAEAERQAFNVKFEQLVSELTIELQKSEQRFRKLVASVPGAVYEFCIDAADNRSLPFISDSIFDLIGLSSAACMADIEVIFQKVPSYALSALEESIKISLKKLTPWIHEFPIHTPTGEKWIRGLSIPHLDEVNGSTHWNGVLVDITEHKLKEAALAESKNLLKTVIDTAPVRIFWKDKQLRYLGCNLAFAKDAGVTFPQDLIGKDDFQLGWKSQAEIYRHDDQKVINSGVPILDYEEPQTTPNGETIWLRTSKFPLCDNNKQIIGVLGIYQDITEQKIANESMLLATTIYQSSNEAIMVTDENNLITQINPAFTRMTGYESEDVIGKNPKMFQSGRHDKEFYQEMWQKLLQHDHWQGEIWDRRKDGTIYAKWINISVIRHPDGRVYYNVAQFSDITEKKQKDELILQQANYDQLTHLPNRNLFKDRLEQEIKKSQRNAVPLSLLLLDLDHFKDINDTYGHDKGDELLKEVAHRILLCVRETDTVARLGGDEFAVILPDIDNTIRIETIAKNINQALNQSFMLAEDRIEYHISTSIGIVYYPQDGDDMKNLMQHTDQAMYAAKEERNRFCYFTPSMQQAANEKMLLTHDLRNALSRNELQIYYQPIFDLSQGRIVKAEALLRWQHPQRGMVSPVVFIPLAEDSGLIIKIGEWVLQQTTHLINAWHEKFGTIIQVSVNMSPVQFKQNHELSWIEKLHEIGLPGNSINIEITEGLLLTDSNIVKDRLLEFRNRGIEVSIDDFGTGFSSLSYLKKFDIDYLKIDRSFVSYLTENSTDRALVEAIIVMAHKLDIKTIAEGIETEEQLDLLLEFGCDYAQGYLYSAPVPIAEFEKLIAKQISLNSHTT